MGTWPSLEWRLPPKQQVGGSNPSVPATKISKNFNIVNIIKPLERQSFRVKGPATKAKAGIY